LGTTGIRRAKRKHVYIDVTELVGLLNLDCVFEVTNCLGRFDFDREWVRFTVNKAEELNVIVGYGVAKHQSRKRIVGTNEEREESDGGSEMARDEREKD